MGMGTFPLSAPAFASGLLPKSGRAPSVHAVMALAHAASPVNVTGLCVFVNSGTVRVYLSALAFLWPDPNEAVAGRLDAFTLVFV